MFNSRKLATATGLFQRSSVVSIVGLPKQLNKCCTSCDELLPNGEMSEMFCLRNFAKDG